MQRILLPTNLYLDIKKTPLVGGLKGHVGQPAPQQPDSHEVCNLHTTVVLVGVGGKSTAALGKTTREWVRDHAVASLETDFWLEGVRVDCSDLL